MGFQLQPNRHIVVPRPLRNLRTMGELAVGTIGFRVARATAILVVGSCDGHDTGANLQRNGTGCRMGTNRNRSVFCLDANSNPASCLAMRNSRSCGELLEQIRQVNAGSEFNGAQ